MAASSVKITVRNVGGALVAPPVGTITIGASAGSGTGTGSGATTLAQLTDVNLTTTPPADGSTLIYNAITSKYDVKVMAVDGGTF